MPNVRLLLKASCATLALVVVAGCGGSDSDGPLDAKPSATASSTPTSAAPTSAERPKDDRSDAGAIDFSTFVVNRVVSVTGGADIDDLLALASDDCVGCINLAKRIQKEGTVKQQFDAPPAISGAEVIDTSDDGSEFLVEQVLELPTGRKVDTATGATLETFAEPTKFSVRVLMTWTDDRWVLSNYSSKKAA